MANDRCFRALSINIPAVEPVSRFDSDSNFPLTLGIQRGYGTAAGNECTALLFNCFQGALNTVKDVVQDARTKRDIHWAARSYYGFSWAKACSLFIYLNRGKSAGDTDDFTDQPFLPDIHHLHHGERLRGLDRDDWAVDTVYDRFIFHVWIIPFPSCGRTAIQPPSVQSFLQTNRAVPPAWRPRFHLP